VALFEEHVQEVFHQTEARLGLYDRQALVPAMGVGGKRQDLGDAAQGVLFPGGRVLHLPGVGIGGGKGCEPGHPHRHGVGALFEGAEEMVKERGEFNSLEQLGIELGELRRVGQFAVQEQVGGFDVGAVI
jgi:hypothetical protein